MCDYLPTVKKEGPHGEAFAYKSVNAVVLGWVIARATGRSLAQLLHARLWAPLGCEEDGYSTVDAAGMPSASGGLSASLRDLARFGELMRCEGEWNGKQLIPAAAVHEVQRGGDRAKFAKAGLTLMPGYSYGSMWWVTHNELGAFEGLGAYGRRLYVAPKAEMVVARFGSHPHGVPGRPAHRAADAGARAPAAPLLNPAFGRSALRRARPCPGLDGYLCRGTHGSGKREDRRASPHEPWRSITRERPVRHRLGVEPEPRGRSLGRPRVTEIPSPASVPRATSSPSALRLMAGPSGRRRLNLGIDTGGTFTDLAVIDMTGGIPRHGQGPIDPGRSQRGD